MNVDATLEANAQLAESCQPGVRALNHPAMAANRDFHSVRPVATRIQARRMLRFTEEPTPTASNRHNSPLSGSVARRVTHRCSLKFTVPANRNNGLAYEIKRYGPPPQVDFSFKAWKDRSWKFTVRIPSRHEMKDLYPFATGTAWTHDLSDSDRLQEAQNAVLSQQSGTAPAAGPLAGLPTRPQGDGRPEETRLALGTTIPTPTVIESVYLPSPSIHRSSANFPRFDAPRPSRRRRQVVSEQAPIEVRSRDHSSSELQARVQEAPSAQHALPARARRAIGEIPYPEDAWLITRFQLNAEAGGSNLSTASIYSRALTKFSAWLRQNDKPGLHARLFEDELANDLKQFVMQTQKWYIPLAILDHIRQSVTNDSVQIPRLDRKPLQIPDEDDWLICEAFSETDRTSITYRNKLKLFSSWLHEKGEPGLCDEGKLHSKYLTEQAKIFSSGKNGRNSLIPALKHLRNFDRTGTKVYQHKNDTRTIPVEDILLSEKFAAWLREQGYGGKVNRRGKDDGAAVRASALRSFCAWMQRTGRASTSLASRLQSGDRSLDTELDFYTYGSNANFVETMKTTLRLARHMVGDSHGDSVNNPSRVTGLGHTAPQMLRLGPRSAAELSASRGSVN
ncbi:hypothetical protein DFQ15_105106, partial [Xylophilus ampelinus]